MMSMIYAGEQSQGQVQEFKKKGGGGVQRNFLQRGGPTEFSSKGGPPPPPPPPNLPLREYFTFSTYTNTRSMIGSHVQNSQAQNRK